MAFATVASRSWRSSSRAFARQGRGTPLETRIWSGVVLSAAIVIAALYLPVLNEPLGTVRWSNRARRRRRARAVPFACAEVGKAVLRRRARQLP